MTQTVWFLLFSCYKNFESQTIPVTQTVCFLFFSCYCYCYVPPTGHKAMMPSDVCLYIRLAGPRPAARRAQPMWAWLRAVNHQAALCGWAWAYCGGRGTCYSCNKNEIVFLWFSVSTAHFSVCLQCTFIGNVDVDAIRPELDQLLLKCRPISITKYKLHF